MSDETSSEREAAVRATDDPEVEGHAVIRESDEADAEEPDVEGHAMTKHVEK